MSAGDQHGRYGAVDSTIDVSGADDDARHIRGGGHLWRAVLMCAVAAALVGTAATVVSLPRGVNVAAGELALASQVRSVFAGLSDDGGSASDSLKVDCGEEIALFVCTARFELRADEGAGTYVISIMYEPVAGDRSKTPLWAPLLEVDASRADAMIEGKMNLFRLSPSDGTQVARLFSRRVGSAVGRAHAEARFVPASSGQPELDGHLGPFANVSGAPTWSIITFAATLASTPSTPAWNGMLLLDHRGYVVWAYHVSGAVCVSAQASSQTTPSSGSELNLQLTWVPNDLSQKNDSSCLGDSVTTNLNLTGGMTLGSMSSAVTLLRPTGDSLSTTRAVCSGAATNWIAYSHELWPEGANQVLTIKSGIATVEGGVFVDRVPVRHVVTDQIVLLDQTASPAGERLLYDLSALFPPSYGVLSDDLYEVRCNPARDALPAWAYLHASSVRRVPETGGDLAATLRNWDAFTVLAADGAGPRWLATCSTGLQNYTAPSCGGDCVLAPEDASACFAAPHSVHPLNATHFLLMDDGELRHGPGDGGRADCKADSANSTGDAAGKVKKQWVSCYTRAILLIVDPARRTFRLGWQFSYGSGGADDGSRGPAWSQAHDLYEIAGGSAYPLPPAEGEGERGGGGASPQPRILVGFTGVDGTTGASAALGSDVRAFETDLESVPPAVYSQLAAPRPNWQVGAYRLTPLVSVAGETTERPFPVAWP